MKNKTKIKPAAAGYQSYRARLRDMPPMTHDEDPTKSFVLSFIQDALKCDIKKSIAVFHTARNKKRRIVVFDHATRTWRGENHMDAPAEIRAVRQENKKLRAEMDDVWKILRQYVIPTK